MSNGATTNRDIQIAHAIEEGRIIVWADGFGVWHAKVLKSYTHPIGTARLAIRLMLQERAPRDTYVDLPEVVHTPEDSTDTHHAYKED